MTDSIVLDDAVRAPDLQAPGVTFRRFRGEGDFPRMADLINAANRADDIQFLQTPEELANDYAHLTNCDLAADFVMAETASGEVVAYTRLWWDVEDSGLRRYLFALNVHPDWRRPELERGLMRWCERRAGEIARGLDHDGGSVLQAWVMDRDRQTTRLAALEAEGYQAVRYGFLMTRDLAEPIDEPPLPDGLEVRPVTPEHYRPIHNALDEAFRDHWGHRPATEEDFQGFISSPTFDASLWQVAWSPAVDGREAEVAGMVLNFIPHDENQAFNLKRGWPDPIAVRRPWRRKGLARALIMRSLKLLKAQGMTEAALGVDSQNPNGALQLYESCGFRQFRRSVTFRKNL
jgi:ribosomal protein S18 acetylase RimI-like enzyme